MNGRGVVIANPHAGGGTDIDALREAFAGHDVVDCDPADLAERVQKLATSGDTPAFIGVAGGDGSIRAAAEVLLEHSPHTPLLPIPEGTRNHFARDLGVCEIDDAVAAANAGLTRSIDAVSVNGTWFINNSSIGVYPRLVAHREARETELPKGFAAIMAAWHQLRAGRRMAVTVDGTPVVAWAVFVGNNCYGDSLRELTGRERIDEGVLDVRIAHADRNFSRLRIFGAVLFGRVEESPLIDRRTCASVVLDRGHEARVALDGEVVELTSPLRYESHRGALTVLVPA